MGLEKTSADRVSGNGLPRSSINSHSGVSTLMRVSMGVLPPRGFNSTAATEARPRRRKRTQACAREAAKSHHADVQDWSENRKVQGRGGDAPTLHTDRFGRQRGSVWSKKTTLELLGAIRAVETTHGGAASTLTRQICDYSPGNNFRRRSRRRPRAITRRPIFAKFWRGVPGMCVYTFRSSVGRGCGLPRARTRLRGPGPPVDQTWKKRPRSVPRQSRHAPEACWRVFRNELESPFF